MESFEKENIFFPEVNTFTTCISQDVHLLYNISKLTWKDGNRFTQSLTS